MTRVIEAARGQRAVDMNLELLLEFFVHSGVSRRLGVEIIGQVQGIRYSTDHIVDLFGLL
jgi:hypothetical protein